MPEEQDALFRVLEDMFTCDSIVGGALMPVLNAEKAHKTRVIACHSKYFWAIDSFLGFWSATLSAAEDLWRSRAVGEEYQLILLSMLGAFRRYRGAEVLLLHGYPTTAYGLMRDAFDGAIIMAAVAGGAMPMGVATGFDCLSQNGTGDRKGLSAKSISNARRKGEKKAREYVMCPLASEEVMHLTNWREMFNLEVHGNLLTQILHGRSFITERSPLPLMPSLDEECNRWYMLASLRTAWLWLRLMPFLQLKDEAFDETWSAQWGALDKHLRAVNKSSTSEREPLAKAFEHLVCQRFAFAPGCTRYTGQNG